MKKCACCKEIKELSEFGRDKKSNDGLNCYCKACCRKKSNKWDMENSEQRTKIRRKFQKSNPEKCSGYSKKWNKNNPEQVKNICKNWYSNNPEKCNATTAKRRAVKQQRTIKKIERTDKPKVLVFYTLSKELSITTNIKHHVDHIIPFIGCNDSGVHVVSGLHVSWNLQVLTQKENCSKHANFDGTYENESWRKDI